MGSTTVPAVTPFTVGEGLMLRGESALKKKKSFGQSFQTTFIHGTRGLIYIERLAPVEL